MGQVSRRALIGGTAGGAAAATVLLGAGSAQAASYPTLRSGSTGFYVQLLQQRLTRLGYWLGTPDGSFGALTQQAVYAIQKAAGITRDGVVGPGTWSKVNAGVRPAAITTSVAANRLEIHLARQLIKVVRSNTVQLILNTSTGSNQRYQYPDGTWALADTPTGWFSVYSAYSPGWQDGPLGRLYRPRYFNSRDGIAVHGAASIPPYPASHGCARVSTAAMDMIWARNLMPMGSRVVVY
jgi:lipoprotein-anchoring transpeptidase ErfK/SrfK